jgi:hypothetical protein
MKKLLIFFLLLTSCAFAGEDAGLAGAAYTKAKNLTSAGNQTLFPPGTLASPSISFVGDDNTGFYNAAGTIYAILDATVKAYVNGNIITIQSPVTIRMASAGNGAAQVGGAAASAISPIFTYNSDTTTGLGRNSVGQPSMIASATEIMRWTDRQIYQPLINTGGIFVSRTSIKGYKLTTDATATRLTVDGGVDSASNRWPIASGTSYMGTVHVSGISAGATRASVGYSISFKAQRVNSVVSVATGSTMIIEDGSLTGCSADVFADSVTNSFYVQVVGSSTVNVRWGCVAEYMEVNQP